MFIGVFAVVALPLIGREPGSASRTKQVLATLDSALATGSTGRRANRSSNLRKNEQLSSIPWLEQEAAEVRTGAVSAQAAVPGGPEVERGRLLMLCAAVLSRFPAYLVYLRIRRSLLLALLVGLVHRVCARSVG